MSNLTVKDVFITKEVADKLKLNPSYVIRLAKSLIEENKLTEDDVRQAGKRTYIFTKKSIEIIKDNTNLK